MDEIGYVLAELVFSDTVYLEDDELASRVTVYGPIEEPGDGTVDYSITIEIIEDIDTYAYTRMSACINPDNAEMLAASLFRAAAKSRQLWQDREGKQ